MAFNETAKHANGIEHCWWPVGIQAPLCERSLTLKHRAAASKYKAGIRNQLYWGYVGIMESRMEATIVY